MTKILTLWVFAHANAGKTTITEHLLHNSKIINNIWRVDSGDTITDNMKIEQDRWISIRSSLVTFNILDKKIQLVDTPGHIDFLSEVERNISILDSSILVISWADWIEAQTYTIWNDLKKRKIPIIFFINKMDRKWANYKKVISEIKKELTPNIIPLVDIKIQNNNLILENKNLNYLIEEISQYDEEIINLFFENKQKINLDFIEEKISTLTQSQKIFPVIWGSSLKWIWMEKLVYCIDKYLWTFNSSIKDINLINNLSWFVYLVRNEEWKRNLYTKIFSGNINIRDNIKIWDRTEKIKKLFSISWWKKVSIENATKWEIVIINWLNINSWEYIWEQINKNPISKVIPLIIMEIESLEKWKNVDLVEALNTLNDEDPHLNINYDKITGKFYINLMWLIQAEVIQEILKTRFSLETNFSNPLIKHKEVPSKIGKWESSYTQFSAIEFEIKPLNKWTWIKYNLKLSTYYLHKKYQNQAEKLVRKYIKQSKNIINYSSEIIELSSWKWVFESKLIEYKIYENQKVKIPYYWLDPRNETKFIKWDMKGSLEILDIAGTKKIKASRSKFKRGQL